MNGNITILVVDDDPAILMGLRLKIQRHGFQVITAKDGAEGLEMAREHTLPDFHTFFRTSQILRENCNEVHAL